MKKIIIVRGGSDKVCAGFADSFVQNSVSVTICNRKELEELIITDGADAVFSVKFDPVITDICRTGNLPCISFVSSLPAPGLFSPALIYENNRIFIPDEETYEIFHKTGFRHIYRIKVTAAFPVFSYSRSRAELLAARIMMHLEDDEKIFLQGLFRAQEVCPEKNILFRALGDDLIRKMYLYTGFSDRDVLIKKRYVISECIFRPVVTKYEDKTKHWGFQKRDFTTAVDEILKNCADF